MSTPTCANEVFRKVHVPYAVRDVDVVVPYAVLESQAAHCSAALHCCKAHAKINGKIENSTPCKIVTHEDFNSTLGTRDYIADTTHHTTLGSNQPSGGFPQIGKILKMLTLL